MTVGPIDTLNDRERNCLRLVGAGYNTKEIARELGISDLRAKKIIVAAMNKLGVSRRQEAARLLAACEDRGVRVVPGTPRTLPSPPDVSPDAVRREGPRLVVREERLPFGGASPDVESIPLGRGETRNDLTNQQMTIRIVALIACALLGVGILIYALGSLSDHIILVPQN